MATFGNENYGTDKGGIYGLITGSWYTTGTVGGYADSMTTHVEVSISSHNVKCAIYAYDGDGDAGALLGTTEEIGLAIGFNDWKTFAFVNKPYLEANTNYFLVAWASDSPACYVRMDSADANKGVYKFSAYNGFPDPFTGEAGIAKAISIYCSYTPGYRPVKISNKTTMKVGV